VSCGNLGFFQFVALELERLIQNPVQPLHCDFGGIDDGLLIVRRFEFDS
jgi:hypothetical protein